MFYLSEFGSKYKVEYLFLSNKSFFQDIQFPETFIIFFSLYNIISVNYLIIEK